MHFKPKCRVLSQNFLWRRCPQTPFLSYVTATRDIKLLATRDGKQFLKCYIWSVPLCGSESWTISTKTKETGSNGDVVLSKTVDNIMDGVCVIRKGAWTI